MLSKKEIETIIEAFLPYRPKKIAVFGSVARNEEKLTSDIDILYTMQKPISLFTVSGIKIYLEEKFQRKVDLVSEDALHPKLKDTILKDSNTVYAAA